MDSGLILFFVIVAVLTIGYLLYYWTNSGTLSDEEVHQLAIARRFWEVNNYLTFTQSRYEVNRKFKSALNKNGQVYRCDVTLRDFPSVAAGLLKSKKHEWVVFAFCKNKKVFSFYTNKGENNQSVSPVISTGRLVEIGKSGSADLVLQFHNHPNAVLIPSGQDHVSTKYFGRVFNTNFMTFTSFVCGAGSFHQYGWWIADSQFSLDSYFEPIQRANDTSRTENFRLRRELKRKSSFKERRLRGSSHNI